MTGDLIVTAVTVTSGEKADLKDNYGYRKAYSSGMQAMRIQGAFAIFAANLHRIMVLMDGKQQNGAE